MKPKIFIDGEHGTTGLQIRTRMADRADVELLSIPEAERRNAAMREDLLNAADIAILCLPDDASKEAVAMTAANNKVRIIDTSTAHRVHPDWTYGFAEMDKAQGDRIADARFVANPGCWPQGLIGTVRPLIEAGLLPADFAVTYNGISGYSGGGKQMIAEYEAAGADASHFMPYAMTFTHKHLPEMTAYTGLSREPLFVPTVGTKSGALERPV